MDTIGKLQFIQLAQKKREHSDVECSRHKTMKKRTMKVLFVFGFRRWNRLTLFIEIVDSFHFCDGCGHLVGCRQVGMIVIVPRQRQQIVDAVDAVFRELFSSDLCGHDVVSLPAGGTPEVTVSAVVTANDATDFPPFQAVLQFARCAAYLAHDDGVVVVSGQSFFGCFPVSSFWSSASFSSACLTTSGTWKNALAKSMTTP